MLKFFNGNPVRRWGTVGRIAMRKLEWLNAARDVNDLRVPPGNRLEKLSGNRTGQYRASESMTNGGCALSGVTETPGASRLWTIIDGDIS